MAVEIDFNKMGGLTPAIVQDAVTGEVLMLGFMNQAAYEKTLQTRIRYLLQPHPQSALDQGGHLGQPAQGHHGHGRLRPRHDPVPR